MQAVLHGERILFGKLELVDGVEFGVDLDGLDRRPAQPQHVHPRTVSGSRHRLDLQRPRDRRPDCTAAQITLWTTEVSGSIVTMPPLTRRGERGLAEVICELSLACGAHMEAM